MLALASHPISYSCTILSMAINKNEFLLFTRVSLMSQQSGYPQAPSIVIEPRPICPRPFCIGGRIGLGSRLPGPLAPLMPLSEKERAGVPIPRGGEGGQTSVVWEIPPLYKYTYRSSITSYVAICTD